MITVCICGGGSLGHVIAGYLGAKEGVKVNILTRRPDDWSNELSIHTPDGNYIQGKLNIVTDNAATATANAQIVILCLPGYAIKGELQRLQPHIKAGTFVGSVFSSTGFFFEAMAIFDNDIPLWGFQRVPFIARTTEYGRCANLLGYKNAHNIAVENCDDKEAFRQTIETLFDRPTTLLKNHYEASFTNSNPILHPSRLYSLFGNWDENVYYDKQFLFYEEWDNSASENLIALDKELFTILDKLPVTEGYLMPILQYYESYDAQSLTDKIRSIAGFKGITTPMIQSEKGWQPDLDSRYFQEDFKYGLKYIYQTAHELKIDVPTIDKIYHWATNLMEKQRQ
ncbi:MAG: NAD/NADP octopine/nopaline dehydrogenase family protein [Bacteroidaceae bacterium]|nr:NAD/NADP octopine/nopaline dehydrogenase family protein [Bacteroidaceae bacterium]